MGAGVLAGQALALVPGPSCREATMPNPWPNLWFASNPWSAGPGWVEFERKTTEMLIELAKHAVMVWMSAVLVWTEAFRPPTATRRSDQF